MNEHLDVEDAERILREFMLHNDRCAWRLGIFADCDCGLEEAIVQHREAVRTETLAACARCGKRRPDDGYAEDALCYGPLGDKEPHDFLSFAALAESCAALAVEGDA